METDAPGAPQQPVQMLGNLAQLQPGAEMGTVSHYDVQPVLDIYANVVGTDLGTVTREMERIVKKYEKELPRGSHIILRGQSETMQASYVGLLERPGVFDSAGLPADRGEFPVMARSVPDYLGVARGAGRNCVVPVR